MRFTSLFIYMIFKKKFKILSSDSQNLHFVNEIRNFINTYVNAICYISIFKSNFYFPVPVNIFFIYLCVSFINTLCVI